MDEKILIKQYRTYLTNIPDEGYLFYFILFS